MSSLVTLRGNVIDNVPFSVLATKPETKDAPHGVYLCGGTINSFTEMNTDYTCLDIDESLLEPLGNQQLPIPVDS